MSEYVGRQFKNFVVLKLNVMELLGWQSVLSQELADPVKAGLEGTQAKVIKAIEIAEFT